MGNVCQSAQLRLREEFQKCHARQRGIQDIRHVLQEFKATSKTPMVMAFTEYQQLFHEDKENANRQFRLLCERCSVTDLARPNKLARGSTMTVFSIKCFLCCASPKDKAKFMFELFDLNHSTSLTHDEVVVLLTCLFRALCTLDADNTQYCDTTDIETMADEPFVMATLDPKRDHLTWQPFWKWAKACMRLQVFSVCLLGSRFPSPTRKSTRKGPQKQWETRKAAPPETERNENLKTSWARTASRRWTVHTTDESDDRHETVRNDNAVPQYDIWQNSHEEINPTSKRESDAMHPTAQYPNATRGQHVDYAAAMNSSQTSPMAHHQYDYLHSTDRLNHDPSCEIPRSIDQVEGFDNPNFGHPPDIDQDFPSIGEYAEYSKYTVSGSPRSERTQEASEVEQDDDEFEHLDAQSAVTQILKCLPEIEEGNLESLPWVMESLGMLSKSEDCVQLKPAIPTVLPLICNVAACDDATLSTEALLILASLLDQAFEMFPACVDAVNDKALLEMCLFKSVESDLGVAAAADCCLEQIAKHLPYGLGATIAGILEAGTLHDNPSIVTSCAHVIDKCLEEAVSNALLKAEESSTSPLDYLKPDLDGRAGLLLSALSIWAHGSNESAQNTAKLVILRLSIHFAGNEEWEQAITESESPILAAWHAGREVDGSMGPAHKFSGGYQIIPCSKMVPKRCNNSAYMYPQVFAILGFKGRGGEAVGIEPHSEFDCFGSFRKIETVVEKRTVEITKVLDNGKLQTWVEEEEHCRETTLLQNGGGDQFAKREKVSLKQKEVKDGETVTNESEDKDFVHFKNEKGEFASFIKTDCDPQSTSIPVVDTKVSPSVNKDGWIIPSPRKYPKSPSKRSPRHRVWPHIQVLSSKFGSSSEQDDNITEIITDCDVVEPVDDVWETK